ncbi:MAG: response regulator transcription factor [Syntrophobacteraceae bacterium]
MEKKMRVFLADDHAVVRDGLCYLLEAQGDIQVTGSAGDGREAVHRILTLKPDIVIMDITMPGLNGIEAIQQVREHLPTVNIRVLSMHSSAEHVFRAFKAGAKGYLLKESAGKELIDAVRTVCLGKRYISSKVAGIMANNFLQGSNQAASPIERLSMREREVMQLIVEGKSCQDIGKTLNISVKTVETYRSRLMQKLEISDIPSLVRIAIANGFATLD